MSGCRAKLIAMQTLNKRGERTPPIRRDGKPRRGVAADFGREAWSLFLQLHQAEKGKFLRALADRHLSGAQALLLLRLLPGQPVPMNELAESLCCDASNITGLVDKLETRRLIARQPAAKDRRVKLIAITRDGERVQAELKAEMSEPPPCIASLGEQEKKALRDILRKATRLA